MTIYFRISPAQWEEPRCYWQSPSGDNVTTLQPFSTAAPSAFDWTYEQGAGGMALRGAGGYLCIKDGKLASCQELGQAQIFVIHSIGSFAAFSPVGQPGKFIECEDGNLGAGTDIQVWDGDPLPTTPWATFDQIPNDVRRHLWKLDPVNILPQTWMDRLPDSRGLEEVLLCGTHDSCAYTFKRGNYSKTQDLDIWTQLNAGVRYLDIRVGDDFLVYHSKDSTGVKFTDVLTAVKGFIALPGSGRETIVMSIKREGTWTSSDSVFTSDLNTVLDQSGIDWYFENRIPKLSEVRGRVVLVRRYIDTTSAPRGIDLSVWGPVHDNDSFDQAVGTVTVSVQDEYRLTENSTKWGYIATLLPNMVAGTGNHWYINFTSAGKGQNPYSYSDEINLWLGSALNFYSSVRGVFAMDYPSPALVDRIIRMNR